MALKDILKKISEEKKVIQGEAVKDKLYSSQQDFHEREKALREFERSKEKLFDVNRWSRLPGITSGFQLYTPQGEPKPKGRPQPGDFLMIDLPGPAPENWVVVTDVKEEKEMAEFTVSPSRDPRDKGEETKEVEHFFSDGSTSTFKVELKGTTLYGYEIGKNEGINNKGKKAGDREIINTLIAEGGWAFFQKIQWEKLTAYLVHQVDID